MIPQWVSKYIGVPFKDKGRSYAGFDCWGLVHTVLQDQFGIETPSFDEAYSSHADHDQIPHLFSEGEVENWQKVTQAQEGDVIIIRWKGRPLHVGIACAPGWMLHSIEGPGVVREPFTGAKYGSRVWAILRHKSRCHV